jgi:hypothetical protein
MQCLIMGAAAEKGDDDDDRDHDPELEDGREKLAVADPLQHDYEVI